MASIMRVSLIVVLTYAEMV